MWGWGNPWLLFSFSMIILRHSRAGGNPWLPFFMITLRHSRVGGSMVAVLVLHDNTESFPRRRESTGRYSELYRLFHFSFVGWAKRSVPNALDASIPDVCQSTCLNCQAAKSESPHPVFQVAGHACVERSLGFACHDVEGGLFYDRCSVMDSRLRGNDGGGLRRRESTGRYSDSYRSFHFSFVGWAKRSVPNALDASIPDVCQSTCLNCQAAKSDVPTSGFSGYWSRLCRVFPWLCWP